MNLTNIGTYKRFLSTWDAHLPRVQALMLSAIKADLRRRLNASRTQVEAESEVALTVGDMTGYEQELMTELEDSTSTLDQRRITGPSSQLPLEDNEESTQTREPTLFTEEDASDDPGETDTRIPFQEEEVESGSEL
jgi:hypothetical protein